MGTVWYTDDDEEMTKAVRLMLRLLGYEMRPFLNARAAARALLAGEMPDLLFLDVNMPEVSGLDLLEFVRRRQQWSRLPVIMLSSEAADVQIDHALSLGADAYLAKPITIDELEQAIDVAIKKRH